MEKIIICNPNKKLNIRFTLNDKKLILPHYIMNMVKILAIDFQLKIITLLNLQLKEFIKIQTII